MFVGITDRNDRFPIVLSREAASVGGLILFDPRRTHLRTGKRDSETTDLFVRDLRQHVLGLPEIWDESSTPAPAPLGVGEPRWSARLEACEGPTLAAFPTLRRRGSGTRKSQRTPMVCKIHERRGSMLSQFQGPCPKLN